MPAQPRTSDPYRVRVARPGILRAVNVRPWAEPLSRSGPSVDRAGETGTEAVWWAYFDSFPNSGKRAKSPGAERP